MSRYRVSGTLVTLVILLLVVSSPVLSAVIRVSPLGDDSNDGSSWTRAKLTLGNALDAAALGDEIWVAAGVYVERITLKQGVVLFGGFAGHESAREERNWRANDTMLDGNHLGTVVVVPSDAGMDTIIDGFTIRNGLGVNGGGIYCESGSAPVIANNTIIDNSAADPTAYKPSGGGIFCFGVSSPLIVDNVIKSNSAFRGGGIFTDTGSSPVIANNIIAGNTVDNHGGGIYSDDNSQPSIYNNTIVANEAELGGGIFCDNKSAPKIANDIVAFNSTGGVFRELDSTADLLNNCVFGNTGDDYTNVDPKPVGDVSADPRFAAFGSGDYHLLPSSPCIDKGYDTVVQPEWLDVDGQERFAGSHVDIGADEWQPQMAPRCVSLAPKSGTFTPDAQIDFRSVYSDANGSTDISGCFFLINTAFGGTNAVYLRYDVKTNLLYVRNDPNTAWVGGFAPGSASVLENTQFKLHCAQTKVFQSGNNVEVNWSIEFKPAMSGKRCGAWMYIIDNANLKDGWRPMGSLGITRPPVNVGISPSAGFLPVGSRRTVSSTYSDADGYQDISSCYLLINTSFGGARAVYLRYDVVTNKLYVRNDANTTWGTGYPLGSANVLENSACRLYCSETTKTVSGNNLTVGWKIELKPTLSGKSCGAWLLVYDKEGSKVGWHRQATFAVDRPPTNVSVSLNNSTLSTGTKTTLTGVFSDPDGYANLSGCCLLVNTALSGASAIYTLYDVNANKLYVRNNANTSWGTGYAPGSPNMLENSAFRLYCAETTVSGSGNSLTVSWRIEPKSTILGKDCFVWMLAIDDAGLRDGWDQMGTCKVGADRPPTNVSVSLNSSTLSAGMRTTLTGVFSDPDGYDNLSGCCLLVNTMLSGASAVYTLYDPDVNKLYVRNDANTSWGTGYAPGSPNILENSAFRLYCAETTVSGFGDSLTVKWRIEPKYTMLGKDCAVWMLAIDDAGLRDGWDRMATCSIR